MRLVYLAITMSLVSCGDDAGGGDGQGSAAGAKAAPAAVKPGAPLRVMTHVEDRVTTQREKQSIRHPFKERDFAADANRDPFQSAFMNLGPEPVVPVKPGDTTVCEAKKQKAGGFSYNDLRLVGIQAMGTQRKALVMGGTEGYTIKRLDCVGKEKAIVDEISDGYVRLKIASAVLPNGATPTAPEMHDIELHPKELSLDGLMDPNRIVPSAPVPDVPLKPTPVPAANVPTRNNPPVNNLQPTQQPPTTLTP